MISTGYNQIKWGILISIIHIYISTELGGFEIVPAFIGIFLLCAVLPPSVRKQIWNI